MTPGATSLNPPLPRRGMVLLDLDRAARFFDLLLDVLGFVLGRTFLERRGAVDQGLGFLEAKARDATDNRSH